MLLPERDERRVVDDVLGEVGMLVVGPEIGLAHQLAEPRFDSVASELVDRVVVLRGGEPVPAPGLARPHRRPGRVHRRRRAQR